MDILLGPKFSLQNSLNVYIGNFVMESSCFCTFIVLLHSYLCSLLKVLYSKPLKIGITCLHVLLLFCLLFAFLSPVWSQILYSCQAISDIKQIHILDQSKRKSLKACLWEINYVEIFTATIIETTLGNLFNLIYWDICLIILRFINLFSFWYSSLMMISLIVFVRCYNLMVTIC